MAITDRDLLRELAVEYLEICKDPVQEERKALWKRHNSLKKTRPLIYIRAFAWQEMPGSKCFCRDPLFRYCEDFFRRHIFWNTLGDDSIFHPWLPVKASFKCTGWGIEGAHRYSGEPRGSFKIDYPLKSPEDIDKLRIPEHEIDEAETAERVRRLQDAVGDIITVVADRSPAYMMWSGDISTTLGFLRGIENFMLDMLDNPQWLHRLVKFLAAGILKTHDEAEQAGDWNLCAHQNQAMPYAEELPDPAPGISVSKSRLWGYMASQEFTCVSPAMYNEFLLRYQMPILQRFGLVSYGCCENLTAKIHLLRQIPNLRRIGVSPFADLARCAEQIGRDYILSYRPSPADMVSYGLDAGRIRSILKNDFAVCKDSYFDITLKDVETVQGDTDRIRNWVNLVRDTL